MGFILSIETATSVCSVALHTEEGKLVGIVELFRDNVHAKKLVPLIEALFQQTGIRREELVAVAVSSGPGSYTGLRIGVSTAKGLAYGLDIPLIGVDTLEALGRRAVFFMDSTDVVIPMIDARRMEVYCKVLSREMEEIAPLAPVIVDAGFSENWLSSGRVFFIGNANEKVESIIKDSNAMFVPLLNSAHTVGEVATSRFRQKLFEDIAYFEPNYLKEFRALKAKERLLL